MDTGQANITGKFKEAPYSQGHTSAESALARPRE